MTIWTPDLSCRTGPRYLAIADAISDAVHAGELPAGSKLPPQRDLAWRLGVTVGTIGRAYLLAEQRGLLSGEVGRGTFVRAAAAASPLPAPARDGVMDLTRNAPSHPEVQAALAETLRTLSARDGLDQLLRYGPEAGHYSHRSAGAAWIARSGLKVSAEQIVLLSGAQQGIAGALAGLMEPGQRLLCEQLTYCGLLDAARMLNIRPEGVAIDAEGMCPDALEAACRAGPVRMVVIVPTVHNPTTATMGLDRRRRIAEIARRHDLLLVEDDVYGYLPMNRPPPIATLAPERTIYVASASKCITPGLRVAWLAAPLELVRRLADTMQAFNVAVPALPAQILSQWIEDGTADRLADAQRQECRARHSLAAQIFDGFEMLSQPCSLHIFLTLPEPWRAQEFANAARERGVLVVPAGTFAVGRAEAPHAVRISLAAAGDRSVLRTALDSLAELAMSVPGARRAVI